MRTENEMEKIAQEYSDLLVRRGTSWTLERDRRREELRKKISDLPPKVKAVGRR